MPEGSAPAMEKSSWKQFWTQSPYAPRGQQCALEGNVGGKSSRSGPCAGEFGIFRQCDIGWMVATVAFDMDVIAAAGNILVTAQTVKAYQNGQGNPNTGTGLTGNASLAETTVGETNALSPGTKVVFEGYGLAIGLGEPYLIDDGSGENLYGTDWIKQYRDPAFGTIWENVGVKIQHGNMNAQQDLGNLGAWTPYNLQNKLPQAGQYAPFRCRELSGAVNDPDKLFVELSIEKPYQIVNSGIAPTVISTIKWPVKIYFYGNLACRGRKGPCADYDPDKQDD